MAQCNLENIWIDKSDFDCIGQVAKHCDWDQLCVFIREQKNLFIIPKIGYCLVKIIDANPSDETVQKLLCGGEYEKPDGTPGYFFGLKRVLTHASYAAYIFRHGMVDTPFGVVQKLNQDSLPTPLNELRSIKNEHYNNALLYMDDFKAFLDTFKDVPLLSDCFENSCNPGQDNVQTQRRQYSFANITKDDKY